MPYNGLILIKPTSATATGTGSSATISANGSVSFSDCVTLSLNDVFSSDYDNYRIVIRFFGGVSTSYTGYYRLRNAGDDATASNYTYQTLTANGTSIAGERTSSTNYGYLFMVGYDAWSGCVGDIYGPYLAQPTASRATNIGSASGGAVVWDLATTHSLSNSYDGISLMPGGDHFSGRVAVYGMRK